MWIKIHEIVTGNGCGHDCEVAKNIAGLVAVIQLNLVKLAP